MNSIDYGIRLLMSIVLFAFIFHIVMGLKKDYEDYKNAENKLSKLVSHILISINMALIFYMILGLINIGIEVLNK